MTNPVFTRKLIFPLYSIRGSLGTLLSLTRTSGIVVGYALASWTDYYTVPYVCLSLTLVFAMIFVWLPESPEYLRHTNQIEKAKLAYAFYGTQVPEVKPGPTPERERISWKDFQEPAVRRGCCVALAIIFFKDLTGAFVVIYYVTELLQKANMQFDVYVVTVAIGLMATVGCVLSTICMDRLGRRILFMTSALLSSISVCAFAVYFNLLRYNESSSVVHDLIQYLHWLPVVSLASFVISSALAINAAPYFLISELMPTKFRGKVTTAAIVIAAITSFIVSQSFHKVVEWIGVDGAHWVFASVCLIEFFYVYFYLPETKNLTIEEIQVKLVGKTRINNLET